MRQDLDEAGTYGRLRCEDELCLHIDITTLVHLTSTALMMQISTVAIIILIRTFAAEELDCMPALTVVFVHAFTSTATK